LPLEVDDLIEQLAPRGSEGCRPADRAFDVSWPAVSQQLRVLRQAGLVSERREGTKRFYRARPEGLGEVRAYLDGFWDVSLGKLKREVERG